MPSIQFTVPGKPSGKGRPRFSRKSGRAFTPAKTQSYEAQVKHFCAEAMGNMPPIEGPIRVEIIAVFAKAKSWSKKKTRETYWHTSSPDADNLAKVLDGLNGIAWGDDRQVALLQVSKIYSDDGREYMQVFISDMEQKTNE
jgi:Holliday junction resolvase RusA-like endonuclease